MNKLFFLFNLALVIVAVYAGQESIDTESIEDDKDDLKTSSSYSYGYYGSYGYPFYSSAYYPYSYGYGHLYGYSGYPFYGYGFGHGYGGWHGGWWR